MTRIAIATLLIGAFTAAGASAATPDPDGRYRGTHVTRSGQNMSQEISFRVSDDGRRITGLRTTASTICVGPTLFDNRIFIAPVHLEKIHARRNGRFKGVSRPARGTKLQVVGRRRGRRVVGRIEAKVGNCRARDKFVARRVGR